MMKRKSKTQTKNATPRKRRMVAQASPKLISYIRVSTDKQGKSGLGMEGQEEAIKRYAAECGGKVLASYVEVESGKNSERPELLKALAHAKRSNARLVVAKLDRLSRNLAFLAQLMESKCDFVAVDQPHATPLTIHILAAVAEAELKAISERTKTALQAAKARGQKLGAANPLCKQLSDEARQRGIEASKRVRMEKAQAAYADLLPQLLEWKEEGVALTEIARRLNEQGHTTRRGAAWNPTQVQRVLQRA